MAGRLTASGADATVSAYEPLDLATVEGYLDGRPAWRSLLPDGPLTVTEVGDGNLNLVFIVRSAAEPERSGLVLKQSLPWVRVFGAGWPLTVERAVHEAHAYERYGAFEHETLPTFHGFDAEQYVLAIEDLSGLRVWRAALNDGEIHPGAAAALGRFVARLAFWTSDVGTPAEERKRQQAAAINPELCRITEDLVFTEPYFEHEHNHHAPALDGLVQEVRADARLREEVSVLKHAFLTRGEALIHGDLHTGSVMVGGGRTAVIDPEFAFYGPVAFDLGALWANAAIAFVRADRLDRPAAFREHVAAILPDSWAAFTDELRRLWPSRVDRSLDDAFRERWTASIARDAIGFAGVKAMRRMIGFAHVSDIETLDEPRRSSAAGAVIAIARRLIRERDALATPAAAWQVVVAETAAPTRGLAF